MSETYTSFEDSLVAHADAQQGVSAIRISAVVALAASAGLLLTGRRKAGVAVAAVGTALALLEDPDTLSRLWVELPALLGRSQMMLDRAEQVVEEFTGRGEQLRYLITRYTNR